MVHEFAHAVTPKEHHSVYWLNRANKIGKSFNITINNRFADDEEQRKFSEEIKTTSGKIKTYKYAVVCEKCGCVVYRQKYCDIIKHPQHWRCGKCGGKLIAT